MVGRYPLLPGSSTVLLLLCFLASRVGGSSPRVWSPLLSALYCTTHISSSPPLSRCPARSPRPRVGPPRAGASSGVGLCPSVAPLLLLSTASPCRSSSLVQARSLPIGPSLRRSPLPPAPRLARRPPRPLRPSSLRSQPPRSPSACRLAARLGLRGARRRGGPLSRRSAPPSRGACAAPPGTCCTGILRGSGWL